MSPLASGHLVYWSSGGALLGPLGPLSPSRALELLKFYGRLALSRQSAGDPAGAYLCARLFWQIRGALLGADDWRRAAAGAPSDPRLARLRTLRR
jgi:hypothetical protein